nr:integrase, catalytic region, zinc finger, CCHC-type, peptidase aspartic, catalytic [Tanacetum cinerariifolium]
MKLKSEALKERTKVSRLIKAFTVYPLNTPATLVPKVLPTKSQVKIHIFTLIQLFSEFDKTCKKRITPTGLTEGERGFEQTKACYLQEVIPFFKTLKDIFEGIQKALTKEVKEIKDVFEELEAEVAQYALDRKHDAIELKNLLIANDNLIDARCLALEAELANLRDTDNRDNQRNKDTPDFDSVFVIRKMQASLQGKDNVIRQLKKQLSQLQVTHSDTDRTLRAQATDSQITKLTDQVTHLQAQNDLFKAENDLFRAENDKIKQHYKELYDSIKITHAKHIEQVTKLTTENVNLKTSVSKATVNPQVSARDKHAIDVEPVVPRLRNNKDAHLYYLRHLKESVEIIRDIVEEAKVVRPRDRSIVSAYRVNSYPNASGSQPKSHVNSNRISPAKGVNKRPVEDQPRTNKSHLRTSNHVDSSSRRKHVAKKTAIPNNGVVANQSDLVSYKLVTQSLTTALSIENELLIEGESNFEIYDTNQASQNREQSNKMAELNAPSGQTPAMAPPLRADDQILPHIKWVPIGKSNCYLDLEKSESNPIYKIAVDILKNTNFFRAFTASSIIPSIYIQQFWDTILYDKKAGCYRCQLDEQWFVLTKETLREARHITPVNNNQAFAAPPSIDRLVDFVNQLGYSKLVRNLSNEEFTQSIHTFIEEKWNLSRHTSGKKRATLIVIPSIRFTKLIIHHLQRRHRFHPRPDSPFHLPNEEPVLRYLKFSAKDTKREVFGMPIPGSLITAEIQQASYYQEYLAKVAQHRRKPKTTAPKAPSRPSVSIPVRSAQPVPTSAPAKPQEKKRKQATKTFDKPPKEKKSKHGWVAEEDDEYQKVLDESMKDAYALPRGTLPPVHKKTSPANQYIFQRRVSEPTGSSGHDESPYALLGQSDSEEESEKVVLGAEEGGQDEGQAGPDPGDAEAKVQSIPIPVVHAGSDREHMNLDVADVSPQPSTKQLDEGFTATAYPKVQENLKLVVEEQVLLEEPASSSGTLSSLQHLSRDFSFGDQFFSDKPSDTDKNAETKVESMVNVMIQQALSSISLMTSPIIDLTSRPKSAKEHQQLKATTTNTTTTTTFPPPQAPQ